MHILSIVLGLLAELLAALVELLLEELELGEVDLHQAGGLGQVLQIHEDLTADAAGDVAMDLSMGASIKKCTALEEVSIAKLMAIAVAGLAAVRGASVLGARFFGFSSQAAKMVRALSRRIFRASPSP